MAVRRKQGTKAFISELYPSASSIVSEGPGKLSGHGEDPNPKEPGHSKLEIQPTSPRSCPSEGSGDDSVRGESPPDFDSMEEDSMSEYDNVGSGKEEEREQDYEEDLQTEADRMTYYVHRCPEDETYMEGMDCHEEPDGAEGPSTSRHFRDHSKPEIRGHSKGLCEVEQKNASTLVYKHPGATFVQAPMAEDEEDETEEEDSEEEDDGYFFYEGKDAEQNNNEIRRKGDNGLPQESRQHSQDSCCGQVEQENDADRRNQENTKQSKDITSGSSFPHRGRVREESTTKNQKDCDVLKARGGKVDPTYKPEREHNKDKVYQADSGVTVKAKYVDSGDRVWKKRHLIKDYRDDNRDRDEKHSHQDSKSKNRGLQQPAYCHKPEGGKEKRNIDVDKEKVETQAKAKPKVAPQNSGRDKDAAQHTNDDSRTSAALSCRRNSQQKAHDNTSVQSPDKQLPQHNEEKSRPSQEQGSLSSPIEKRTGTPSAQNKEPIQKSPSFPSFVDIPGPCEPEDLLNGIIFAANYLGSTQLLSDRNPSKSVRMKQAQEALDCVKSVESETHSLTEIDLFISTKAIKVLNADTQETMMDNALRTISYIADIGDVVVLMARRRLSNSSSLDCTDSGLSAENRKQYRMMCYVFESEDAQLIAQSIGQAFSMAYQEFLRANGINPKDLSQKDYSDILNKQEMYNDDLIHFSNSENCKELHLEKQKGEILGLVIVESGWGSILPTVILACMLNNGPAARSGKLNVGDQIMAVNDTSLVGLPLATCQNIIKGLKNHTQVKLSAVSCPPVTTVLIKRPDLQYQLGFSVQNGIICSLMRGGIAERGGVRVGHRIIEINGQSVVAMPHEKIVHTLSVSVGEINMKTMPAVMFRLLTGQETPVYI
ncbi:uncharacterized protein apba2a [Misgurnus anguillicaudatus]|uniref:uncharacterized protein apba2a n=1 Tax=Misgurnus anguillicaudatus TaxID=75329 RepID=UPI003CCF2C07